MQEIDVTTATSVTPKIIQSPAFNHDYPPNSNCSWIFKTTDPLKVVHLNFIYLIVESLGPECMDFVSIYGPSDPEPM